MVHTETKTYKTRAHMGMIDVTADFQAAVERSGLSNGIITGFTTGGVAGLTTLDRKSVV